MSAMPSRETRLVLPSGPPPSTIELAWDSTHFIQACMPAFSLALRFSGSVNCCWYFSNAPGVPVYTAMKFFIELSWVDGSGNLLQGGLRHHHVDSLVAVDELRDVHVGDEAHE